jgi:hypothetical protein
MRKKIIAALIISSLFLCLKTKIPSAAPVSPDKYYIEGESGQVINQEITIFGTSDITSAQKLYIYPVGMKKVGEEHERSFYIPNPDDQDEIANWIEISKSEIIIQKADTLTIPWTLKVQDIKPCQTKLAGIVVSNINPSDIETDATQIKLGSEVVSQIHLNSFEVQEEECSTHLSLKEFSIPKTIKIFSYDNVPFQTKIENGGQVLARSPKGFIEILGFGNRINLEFNSENLDIYPETIRKFDNLWQNEDYPREGNFLEKFLYELSHLRIGRYEARLGVTKNVEANITASTYFWVIPWRVIIVLVAMLTLTFLIAKNSRKEGKPKKN